MQLFCINRSGGLKIVTDAIVFMRRVKIVMVRYFSDGISQK